MNLIVCGHKKNSLKFTAQKLFDIFACKTKLKTYNELLTTVLASWIPQGVYNNEKKIQGVLICESIV